MVNQVSPYTKLRVLNEILIGIDPTVTLITYKVKTVQRALIEIAGLLVLTRILTLILRSFNEWSFNRKMKKENNEDVREVYTY